jgi:hypothetical protein
MLRSEINISRLQKINYLNEKLVATPEVLKSIRHLVYLSKKIENLLYSVSDAKKTIWDIKNKLRNLMIKNMLKNQYFTGLISPFLAGGGISVRIEY